MVSYDTCLNQPVPTLSLHPRLWFPHLFFYFTEPFSQRSPFCFWIPFPKPNKPMFTLTHQATTSNPPHPTSNQKKTHREEKCVPAPSHGDVVDVPRSAPRETPPTAMGPTLAKRSALAAGARRGSSAAPRKPRPSTTRRSPQRVLAWRKKPPGKSQRGKYNEI